MMYRLKALLGVRWLPYAAVGVCVLVGGASLWGYMKGFSAAEKKYTVAMNKALKAQYSRMLTLVELEGQRENSRDRRIEVIRSEVDEVSLPTDCVMPAACVRFYDDVLRASSPDSG